MNELQRIQAYFKSLMVPAVDPQQKHNEKVQSIYDKADKAKEASKNNGKKRR